MPSCGAKATHAPFNERAWGNLGNCVAGRCHTAAVNLEARKALQAPVDGRARRAGHAEQPTPSRDLLNQVDHAQRPGLLAQGVDGLLDALLLLKRKTRGQRLPSAGLTSNGCGLINLGKT